MALIDASAAASKWARRTGQASEDYKAGVQRVTTSPGAAAAAAADTWSQRLAQSETKEKFRRKTGAVSLSDWQNAAINKGAGRLSSGATQAQPRFEQNIGKVLSYESQGLAAIKAMPKVTLEDRKARSAAWIDYMAKYRG